MTCDDLRLGGTLSASGITGGTSINSTAIHVTDWAGLLGIAGISGSSIQVNGRPGGYLAGDQLGRQRFFNLNMGVTRWGPSGVGSLVEASFNEQLAANTDDFLTLLAEPETYLEVDMPDGTKRFLVVTNLDPAYTRRSDKFRNWSIPLVSDWPYWRLGGQEESDAVSGGPTNITVGGAVDVYDAVLVFAGDGTFTHNDLGWAIEVTGSGAAVTVDLGARTVVESGSPALNRIRRTPATGKGQVWGWFTPGANSVTTDVSVTVTRRGQYV